MVKGTYIFISIANIIRPKRTTRTFTLWVKIVSKFFFKSHAEIVKSITVVEFYIVNMPIQGNKITSFNIVGFIMTFK